MAVGLLALTLLLGPANLVLGRPNPVSTYLRRDVGIWTAILSVVHVFCAVLIHTSHGSGPVSSFVHFFVSEDGRPLVNSFGWGNWMGLAATVIVLVLLVTSNDAALRALRARLWKWLQRLNYALIVLVVLHAFFYGAFLRMTSPFTTLLILSVTIVVVGRPWGFGYGGGAQFLLRKILRNSGDEDSTTPQFCAHCACDFLGRLLWRGHRFFWLSLLPVGPARMRRSCELSDRVSRNVCDGGQHRESCSRVAPGIQ